MAAVLLRNRQTSDERAQHPLYATVDEQIYEGLQLVKRREGIKLHDLVNNALEGFLLDYCEYSKTKPTMKHTQTTLV